MDRSIKDAAAHLGVSQKTVRRRIHAGKLDAYKENGKWFIRGLSTPPEHLDTDSLDMSTQPGQPEDPVMPVTTQALDYRHRLQITWTWMGISYEYKKPMNEFLVRDALKWIGKKWRAWREKKDPAS